MSNFKNVVVPGVDPALSDELLGALRGVHGAYDEIQEKQLALVDSNKSVWAVTRFAVKQMCGNDEVPMITRAAWTTALHQRYDGGDRVLLQDLPVRAQAHEAKLTEIDRRLLEPDAPILAVATSDGSATPFGYISHRRPRISDFTLRFGDGNGLTINQYYNNGQDWFYHRVETAESSYKRPGRRPFLDQGCEPVIDGNPEAIIAQYTDVDTLVEAIDKGRNPGTHVLIGNNALSEFMRKAQDNIGEDFDLLLGHAIKSGYTIDR